MISLNHSFGVKMMVVQLSRVAVPLLQHLSSVLIYEQIGNVQPISVQSLDVTIEMIWVMDVCTGVNGMASNATFKVELLPTWLDIWVDLLDQIQDVGKLT